MTTRDNALPTPDHDRIRSPRLRWYNPMLDPSLLSKMTDEMRTAVLEGLYSDGTAEGGGPLLQPDASHAYNLVSSLREDGLHSPALDVDQAVDLTPEGWPMLVCGEPFATSRAVVVPSGTEDHCHVYLPDMEFSPAAYFDFLFSMMVTGVIEERYLSHSLRREQTLLRPPHKPKRAVYAALAAAAKTTEKGFS